MLGNLKLKLLFLQKDRNLEKERAKYNFEKLIMGMNLEIVLI